MPIYLILSFFFFNDTATTEIYTLSLHDALPILAPGDNKTCTITNDDKAATLTLVKTVVNNDGGTKTPSDFSLFVNGSRSEEHTSELQSRLHLVCRLLLEKKKQHNPSTCTRTTLL